MAGLHVKRRAHHRRERGEQRGGRVHELVEEQAERGAHHGRALARPGRDVRGQRAHLLRVGVRVRVRAGGWMSQQRTFPRERSRIGHG